MWLWAFKELCFDHIFFLLCHQCFLPLMFRVRSAVTPGLKSPDFQTTSVRLSIDTVDTFSKNKTKPEKHKSTKNPGVVELWRRVGQESTVVHLRNPSSSPSSYSFCCYCNAKLVLERRFSGEEHLLLSQKTWLWLPHLDRFVVTLIPGSDTLFWLPWHPDTYGTHMWHAHIKKLNFSHFKWQLTNKKREQTKPDRYHSW